MSSGRPAATPSETGPPRFVGMWAVDQRLCADPAWRLEADRISTQGEVSCAFNRVLRTRSGYSIAATCSAESPPAPYDIELTMESDRSMMLLGGPWGHASLVYCKPLSDG